MIINGLKKGCSAKRIAIAFVVAAYVLRPVNRNRIIANLGRWRKTTEQASWNFYVYWTQGWSAIPEQLNCNSSKINIWRCRTCDFFEREDFLSQLSILLAQRKSTQFRITKTIVAIRIRARLTAFLLYCNIIGWITSNCRAEQPMQTFIENSRKLALLMS